MLVTEGFLFLVPVNASETLRRLIEALFITHAETKLNTIGFLDQDSFSNKNATDRDDNNDNDWCQNLVRH